MPRIRAAGIHAITGLNMKGTTEVKKNYYRFISCVLVLILALSLLTACGGGGQAEPDTETTSPPTADAPDTTATDIDKTPEPETPEDTAVITLLLEGESISLPMAVEDFLSLGWEANGRDLSTSLKPERYITFTVTKGGSSINITAANLLDDQAVLTGQATICSMSTDGSATVELPGGVKVGMSESDVIAAYGEPATSNDIMGMILTSYSAEDYSMGFIIESDKIISLSVSISAIAEFKSHDEDMPEVIPFVISEDLPDRIEDLTFDLLGDGITLPMIVEDFIAFGYKKYWLSGELHLDEILEPGQYTTIKPAKNNNVVSLEVGNLSDKPITVEKSTILALSIGDDYGAELAEFPKGIRLGVSSKEDIIAAYGEPTNRMHMQYKKEDYRVYFVFYNNSEFLTTIDIMLDALEGLERVSF